MPANVEASHMAKERRGQTFTEATHGYSNNFWKGSAFVEAASKAKPNRGPTFIVAAVGCPVTWLLSSHTNPNIIKLVGSKVNTLKKEDISEISVEEVNNNLALRH